MRLALIAFALLLAAPLGAQAQESACVTIENNRERLACYDAANGRVPPQAAPDEDGRVLRLPTLFGDDDDDVDEVRTVAPAVSLQIADVVSRNGQYLLVMSNGEVWLAASRPNPVPSEGDQVAIRREGVGFYELTPAAGEPFRVRRQN